MIEGVNTLRVPPVHPVFAGHFPGRPIVPGVMLLEWALREAGRRLDREVCALRLRECKFLQTLLPGETAELHLSGEGTRCAFRIERGNAILVTGVIEPS
jgi:3-hydroxymyristoyl/3-hydroxydecanoyl-(acyl carrier protein) dehydratase